MNLARPPLAIISRFFRFWLSLRKFLPRQRSQAFGDSDAKTGQKIEKIYVINLDREPGRWARMEQELKHILNSSGRDLLSITKRHIAVDAKKFSEDPPKDADVDPIYTLDDQLFVEPQPLVLPTQFELTAPIRMSRAEVAVARSHIDIWRQIADGSQEYALILEDDVWFHRNLARNLDRTWKEVVRECKGSSTFDLLYLSYLEVKNGAPKSFSSPTVFRPVRGLWHLSGYVLSRKGAQNLLRLLPCRGPVDLWINHQFKALNILAARRSLISQRFDAKSTNSYSILPTLTSIGAITSEVSSLFNIRPTEQPVFAFGPQGTGLTSLAMALSMLGYRCCSDLEKLPVFELKRLLEGKGGQVFNAYVNIGCLETKIRELRIRYPRAKFLITACKDVKGDESFRKVESDLTPTEVLILHSDAINKWQSVCNHLRCSPPTCPFPALRDVGQRPICEEVAEVTLGYKCTSATNDKSPWIVERRSEWQGIRSAPFCEKISAVEFSVR